MKLFMVFDMCDDFQLPLGLRVRAGLPPGGLLTWEGDGVKPSLFQSRGDARDAIDRTHHYAMAFG